MSCHWKILGMGGACKVMKLFCHHCGCHSDELHQFRVGMQRCDWCKSESNAKCYHFALDTDAEIEQKRNVSIFLEEKYTYLSYTDDTDFCSQLKRDEFLSDPSITFKSTLPNHIDFVPTTAAQSMQFSNQLTLQLLCRQQPVGGNLEARRARVREVMYDEDTYKFLKRTIKRYDDTRDTRLVPVEWTVPCIMHMHNCVAEKIACVLVRKGFSLRAGSTKKKVFKESVEHTINSAIFGTEVSQSTWKCPMTQDNTTCTDLSFSDGKAKILMNNIDLIISDMFNNGKCFYLY